MNLRDLVNKLDTIAERTLTPAGMDRAAYDKFQADDAKTAAIAQVKKYASIPLNQIPRLANAIDPKTGIIYYGEENANGTSVSPRKMPLNFMSQGDQKSMVDALTAAGLKVVPHVEKGLFGSSQYAKVEPTALQQVITGPVVAPAPAPAPDPSPGPGPNKPTVRGEGPDADIKKLNALVAELDASLGGDIAPQITPPNTNVVKPPGKTTAQKVGIGTGFAAGALTGQQLAKKAGFGAVGQGVAGLTGGTAGALGVNAFQKEGIEYKSSIAQTLTESFGYEFEDRELDEYSMSQLGKDAGDFGRGAWNGVTLGTGDNIAAGVKSAFGPGTYKDELAKQAAASKESETRSPWLYGAGNVAGALAVPIPGGAAGALAARGAKALGAGANVARGAKVAGIVGANVAAMKAVDTVKQKSDLNTFVGPGGDKRIGALQQAIGLVGAQIDGKMGPNTAKAIMSYQKDQGLPVTGKADPATLAKAGLAENRVHTVAEDIRSMQQKLAMIESGQWSLEEDTVYRVWLRPDNTVIDDNGVLITDDELLENIQWDPEFLAEYDYGAKYLGKGYDAIKGAAGRLFGAGRNKATQVATKPSASTTNTVYTRRAGNPNAAKADLPGAPTVTKDLTGAAIKPGELSATGSVGALRAQAAADNAVDAGRVASKATQASVDDMVRGGASSADNVVGASDNVVGVAGKELSVASKAADDVAGVAGKELSAAEKAAASVEAQAAKRSGRLSGWIKANPKKALALGLVGAAAIGAGTVAALGGEEETDPTNGPTNDPDIAPKPAGGLTPEQQALIKQIKELMGKDYGGATEPEQQAWGVATSNAQAVVGKAEKANPAQIAMDKKNAAEAAAVTSAGEKRAEEKKAGDISASPKGTTTTKSGTSGRDANGNQLFKTSPSSLTGPDGKDLAGGKITTADGKPGQVKESDNELARWLKIAHG
jgi:hypothetical protein